MARFKKRGPILEAIQIPNGYRVTLNSPGNSGPVESSKGDYIGINLETGGFGIYGGRAIERDWEQIPEVQP